MVQRKPTKSATWGVAASVGAGLVAVQLARRALAEDLRGKVVLVTGGSRGLGLALAREFARLGARVVICARNREQLDTAKASIESDGAETLAIACDVTDPADVERMVQAALARFGQIDVLVNNAGTIEVGPFAVQTRADFETAMNEIFWSTYNCTMGVLPGMRERRAGRIVNISSIGGVVSVPHLMPYSTAKFAVTGFSEGLRAELMRDGITVTTVTPGLMRTGSYVNALFKGQNAKEYTLFAFADNIPGVTMSAERAARQIAAATRRGDARLVVTVAAQTMSQVHGILPGITADLMGVVNRFLPGAGGIGAGTAVGRSSETPLTQSPALALGHQAAAENNEGPASRDADGAGGTPVKGQAQS